jgi:serine/threonine protein kinase
MQRCEDIYWSDKLLNENNKPFPLITSLARLRSSIGHAAYSYFFTLLALIITFAIMSIPAIALTVINYNGGKFNGNPNITVTPVRYASLENNIIYIVMPFYSRGDLKSYIKNLEKSPSQNTVKQIIQQVAMGLDYLHSQSLPNIHRDLSPDNLLITNLVTELDNDFVGVVISDFDVAREIQKTASHTSYVGKKDYWAPESANGVYGTSVDIWSLGVIILELMLRERIVSIENDREVSLSSKVYNDEATVHENLRNRLQVCFYSPILILLGDRYIQ